ncbi:hypothetical protein LJ754_10445 [Arthrobacter sp. zg-Y40]|uniref:hypothetical protein n=1 Tax=Arthrobacter sp. zg-Y40 TaxID=2886939 RepID=UPI001D1587A0|nr:hypothetical protein [Arthrobacter sp. zg-Y40]MCC3279568.1 hypothetical protein [Arthrobacter sp. zg-Y40]
MTHNPITHVDLFPEFSTMTDAALESLADQAFSQLEDGPLVEGLFAFYLSLSVEIEDRSAGRTAAPTPASQEEKILQTAV